MARPVELQTLRSDCRLYADQRPGGASAFISDTELTRLINQEIRHLYDRLIAVRGHEYYLDTGTLTTIAGTGSYSLDADLMQMIWIGIAWGSQNVEEIYAWDHWERADYLNWSTWSQGSPKAYRLRGTGIIEFLPAPTVVQTIDYRFIPAFTDLVADDDTFDGINGWEEAVTLAVAMKMKVIAEEDMNELARLYERVSNRIDEMAAQLGGAPKRIADVAPRGYGRSWQPRGKAWL